MKRAVGMLIVVLASTLACKRSARAVYCHPKDGEIDAGNPYATLCGAQDICASFPSGYECCSPGRNPGCHL